MGARREGASCAGRWSGEGWPPGLPNFAVWGFSAPRFGLGAWEFEQAPPPQALFLLQRRQRNLAGPCAPALGGLRRGRPGRGRGFLVLLTSPSSSPGRAGPIWQAGPIKGKDPCSNTSIDPGRAGEGVPAAPRHTDADMGLREPRLAPYAGPRRHARENPMCPPIPWSCPEPVTLL